LPSAGGEFVVLGAPIVVGDAPVRGNPAAPLQTMQRGIKRSLLDTQHVTGNLLDTHGDPPAMLRLQRQGLQDEQVERALRQVDWYRRHCFPFASTGIGYARSCRSARGNVVKRFYAGGRKIV